MERELLLIAERLRQKESERELNKQGKRQREPYGGRRKPPAPEGADRDNSQQQRRPVAQSKTCGRAGALWRAEKTASARRGRLS